MDTVGVCNPTKASVLIIIAGGTAAREVPMRNGGPFDYIVVGSGAGGGTLAARLAEASCTVLLLEAGGDPRQLSGTNDDQPGINRLPDDYDVPSFHGFASENEAMRWDFFVRHYASEAMQAKDPKYVRDYRGVPVDGVLYPRAGTLGGARRT